MPRELRDLLLRLFFVLAGVACIIFILQGIRDKKFPISRNGVTNISVEEDPIKFWIWIGVAALLAGLAFYRAFAKGRDDD
jgi:uncharacterized protein with PQ loop repeat